MAETLKSAVAVVGIDIGKIVPHRWPGSAGRHYAATEVVAWPS